MSITIRQANTGDASEIASLHIASRIAAYKNIIPDSILDNQSQQKEETMWMEALRKNPENVLVAVTAEKEIAGFIGFGPSRDRDNEGEIYAIYNNPEYFRSGIGRLLWKAAREQLAARGYSTVVALVITENIQARKFYESVGFKLVEDSDSTFTWEGEVLNEVYYVVHDLNSSIPG